MTYNNLQIIRVVDISFCALFGFSMDYEVFLLTRIKESYQQYNDNNSWLSIYLVHIMVYHLESSYLHLIHVKEQYLLAHHTGISLLLHTFGY